MHVLGNKCCLGAQEMQAQQDRAICPVQLHMLGTPCQL